MYSRHVVGSVRCVYGTVPIVVDLWRPTAGVRKESLNRKSTDSRSGEGVTLPIRWPCSPRLFGFFDRHSTDSRSGESVKHPIRWTTSPRLLGLIDLGLS